MPSLTTAKALAFGCNGTQGTGEECQFAFFAQAQAPGQSLMARIAVQLNKDVLISISLLSLSGTCSKMSGNHPIGIPMGFQRDSKGIPMGCKGNIRGILYYIRNSGTMCD